MKVRTKRKPDEWAKIIRQETTGNMRITVSRIVWWDVFGDRLVGNRWNHLDKMLRFDKEIPSMPANLLVEALMRVGYTSSEAKFRVAGTER